MGIASVVPTAGFDLGQLEIDGLVQGGDEVGVGGSQDDQVDSRSRASLVKASAHKTLTPFSRLPMTVFRPCRSVTGRPDASRSWVYFSGRSVTWTRGSRCQWACWSRVRRLSSGSFSAVGSPRQTRTRTSSAAGYSGFWSRLRLPTSRRLNNRGSTSNSWRGSWSAEGNRSAPARWTFLVVDHDGGMQHAASKVENPTNPRRGGGN